MSDTEGFRVRLLVPRVVDGGIAQLPGQIVDVSLSEGRNMVASGQAAWVDSRQESEPAAEAPTPEPATAWKPTGRKF